MIDTIFFLLVFFMMATLAMTAQEGIAVSLPKAATGQREPVRLTITVAEDGALFLDKAPTTIAALKGEIAGRLAKTPDMVVVLNADKAVSHGRVVEVLDLVRQVGAGRLAIATEKKEIGS